MKTDEQREDQHAVEPDADTARADLTEHHVEQRHHPAERRVAVVHRVHGAGRRAGRRAGEDRRRRRRRSGSPCLRSLPPGCVDVAVWLTPSAASFGLPFDLEQRAEPGDDEPDRDHHREEHVALLLVADELAVRVGEREPDHRQQVDLEEVREPVRVLERVRGVRVPEPAAVRADLLDRLLARARAARGSPAVAFERADRRRSRARFCTTPWRDEARSRRRRRAGRNTRSDAAGEVDPEVADRVRPAAGQAADQGDRDREPDRGRHEVLHREPGHLGEVAHRRLGGVALPVRVRDEADRGVERERLTDPGRVGRVQRQHGLQPLQPVEEQRADDAEREHRERVDGPPLLPVRVDPADPVDQPLDREEDTGRPAPCRRRTPWRGSRRGSGSRSPSSDDQHEELRPSRLPSSELLRDDEARRRGSRAGPPRGSRPTRFSALTASPPSGVAARSSSRRRRCARCGRSQPRARRRGRRTRITTMMNTMSAMSSPRVGLRVRDLVGEHGAELVGERDRERAVLGRQRDAATRAVSRGRGRSGRRVDPRRRPAARPPDSGQAKRHRSTLRAPGSRTPWWRRAPGAPRGTAACSKRHCAHVEQRDELALHDPDQPAGGFAAGGELGEAADPHDLGATLRGAFARCDGSAPRAHRRSGRRRAAAPRSRRRRDC